MNQNKSSYFFIIKYCFKIQYY